MTTCGACIHYRPHAEKSGFCCAPVPMWVEHPSEDNCEMTLWMITK